jgi:hypothetical protein
MDVQILKEPAPLFVFGCILTMVYMFIETRITGEKKPYKDYLIYGVYVGILLIAIQYMTKSGKMKQTISGDKFLIDRFPV